MAVEIFSGQYITADDATKYIDLYTINDSCRNFNAAVERLNDIAKEIVELREMGGADTLFVGGRTLEPQVEQFEQSVRDLALYLSELANNLINDGIKALNRKQTILNDEARQIEQKMQQQKINETRASSAPAENTTNNTAVSTLEKATNNTVANKFEKTTNNTVANNFNKATNNVANKFEEAEESLKINRTYKSGGDSDEQ